MLKIHKALFCRSFSGSFGCWSVMQTSWGPAGEVATEGRQSTRGSRVKAFARATFGFVWFCERATPALARPERARAPSSWTTSSGQSLLLHWSIRRSGKRRGRTRRASPNMLPPHRNKYKTSRSRRASAADRPGIAGGSSAGSETGASRRRTEIRADTEIRFFSGEISSGVAGHFSMITSAMELGDFKRLRVYRNVTKQHSAAGRISGPAGEFPEFPRIFWPAGRICGRPASGH
jgi:hypothetical protein